MLGVLGGHDGVMSSSDGECTGGRTTPLTPESPTPGRRRMTVANIRSAYDRVQRYLTEAGTSEGNVSVVTTSSPVNKRRGFSGRKWLPPPLRKLSQGKVEKGASTAAPDRPAVKKSSDKQRFKLPSGGEMGNKQAVPPDEEDPSVLAGASPRSPAYVDQNGGEEVEEEVELPPPMKPITDTNILAAGSGDEAQGKREQHTENQERNSLLSRDSKASGDDDLESEDPVPGDVPGDAIHKREFVIKELVDTERAYIHDIGLVVEGYMPLMRDPDCDVVMPEDLRGGKDKMVFGNLEAMYEWHRDFFLKALERCIISPQELGPLFKRYERKLHMYVVYCQNKPVSEYICSEHETYFEELRMKLGHKLQLCDLLIKPVQRIMKYQLLLRDVFKYTERAELASEADVLRQALHVMQVVPKSANDMMDVGRLQGFDGKITAQGKLLLHGLLLCSEGCSSYNFKGKELQVFLFEQNIIFSDAVGKKTQFTNPVYIYKAHIQVNKMSLEENVEDKDTCKFVIRSTDPRKTNLGYVCQASSSESRDEWVTTIRNILQTQKDFLIAIQSPIAYQKELTKEVSAPDMHSAWNPSMRQALSQPSTPTNHGAPSLSSTNHSASLLSLPNHSSPSLTPTSHSTSSLTSASHSTQSLTPTNRSTSSLTSTNHSSPSAPSHYNTLPPASNTPTQTRDLTPPLSIASARANSPSKTRLNLFEGFRNTLRSRTKHDHSETERNADEKNITRRWSEVGTTSVTDNSPVSVGSVVKTVSDFRSTELSVQRGDIVQVFALDVSRGYLIRHDGCEGWIPTHVLHHPADPGGRKPWSFRFRKPSFSGGGGRRERRSFDGCGSSPQGCNSPHRQGLIPEYPAQAPEFLERLADVSAPAGTTAELRCRLQPVCEVEVTWRKAMDLHDAAGEVIRSEGRYKVSLSSQGEATLIVDGCRPADSGQFSCTACNDEGSCSTTACLTVVGSSYGVPSQPCAQVLAGTSVLLTWEATGEFLLECCRHRFSDWLPVGDSTTVRGPSHVVEGLTHGETYCFRLVTPGSQVSGLPSTPITIQVTDAGRWQQQQFHRRYVELEELGRGRVAVVVRARDRGTGQEVAAKQVARRRQGHHVTRAEYALLSRLQHPSIVRSLVLFNNAPSPGADTIVMELVNGPYLFSYVCREEEYSEKTVIVYMRQLLSALSYLHDENIAHLDVKPENVLVDLTGVNPVLKLIDFGDASGVLEAELVLPPVNLEFAAPELVIGQPAGCSADMWSVGVFLYAFLSGLSPFLDDSLEETTANILQCGFCFPLEYFSNISNESKDLIGRLLLVTASQRMEAQTCLEFPWFKEVPKMAMISTARLSSFMERRQSSVRPLFTNPNVH